MKIKNIPVLPAKPDKIIISIDPMEVMKRIRKPLPPASQFHRNRKTYTRKQKHPTQQP